MFLWVLESRVEEEKSFSSTKTSRVLRVVVVARFIQYHEIAFGRAMKQTGKIFKNFLLAFEPGKSKVFHF